MTKRISFPFLALGGALALAGCSKPIDLDMRSLWNGFDTSTATADPTARPAPDAQGVISYPTYQVALARRGETANDVAARLGIDGAALARANGISAGAVLRDGELLTLPAGTRVGSGTSALPAGTEPRRHAVQQGETAFSIARLYDVPVQSLAQLNNLDDQLAVRPGQTILIPVIGAATAAPTAPGAGSPTPTPPSSTTPLPASSPAPIATTAAAATTTTAATTTAATTTATSAPPPPQPSPDLPTTSASQPAQSSARLVTPMQGPIVRAYSKGRNDGIDIGGSPGTPVKAADSGTVAAITQNTEGAKVVVIRHSGGLLTVYINLTDMTVSQGSSVSRGQVIGKLSGAAPSLHFEVRRGLESLDPSDFLP